MSTSFTPTSNWTDRSLAGRDLSARPARPRPLDLDPEPPVAPAEPRSFADESEAATLAATPMAADAAVVDDMAYTPAYARTRKRRGGDAKPWLVALPAVLAGAGILGWMALAGGAEETATAEAATVESVGLEGAAPAIAGEPLAGMPMTDLGAPPAPVPLEAAAPAPVTRAAAPTPVRRAPARQAAAAPAAAATAAPQAEAESAPAPVAAEPAPEPVAPAPSETDSAPIIVTEPLTIPN